MKTVEELKELYPLAMKELAEMIGSKLREVPKEIGTLEAFIEMTIMHNPRVLFTFFDEHEVYISLTKEIGDYILCWRWEINNSISGNKGSRPEAEEDAFLAAFQELETKLTRDGK